MFLRPAPTQTLGDLRQLVDQPVVTTVVRPSEIAVDLRRDNVVRFPRVSDNQIVEVPANSTTITHLANLLDVPSKFLERQDREFQEIILQGLIQRQTGEKRVAYAPGQGITAFHGLTDLVITPTHIVSAASKVFPDNAPINFANITPDVFEIEVLAPLDSPEGRLGAVGDLTAAGLRFDLDMKHGTSPKVAPFQYRLVCTNGQLSRQADHAIDARGMTVEQVLNELERQAQLAFSKVEHDVQAFYELRNVPVENPERVLARVAREHGLSDRVRIRLIERAAEIEGTPTMFDIVNLVTNSANADTVKPALRRQLIGIGGSMVSDHHARCNHCQSSLD